MWRAGWRTLGGVAGEVCRCVYNTVRGQHGEQVIDADEAVAGDVGAHEGGLKPALPGGVGGCELIMSAQTHKPAAKGQRGGKGAAGHSAAPGKCCRAQPRHRTARPRQRPGAACWLGLVALRALCGSC